MIRTKGPNASETHNSWHFVKCSIIGCTAIAKAWRGSPANGEGTWHAWGLSDRETRLWLGSPVLHCLDFILPRMVSELELHLSFRNSSEGSV